jgi:hypothetical protein
MVILTCVNWKNNGMSIVFPVHTGQDNHFNILAEVIRELTLSQGDTAVKMVILTCVNWKNNGM